MKETERVKIALPNGELRKDMLEFMSAIGLDFNAIDRRYLIPVNNMPVDFVIIRASSVPAFVTDEKSELKAGITGNDILWEAGMGKEFGEEIPVETFVPDCKKPSLYVGVTNDFYNFADDRLTGFGDPSVYCLSGFTVTTKFPNIASEYFREKSIKNVSIFPVPGTDEAIQYAYRCEGILGIKESGITVDANDIWILDVFYKVTARMIEASDKLTRRDRDILNDLRERIAVAIERKRMI